MKKLDESSREWVAINYYSNKRYRRVFIKEHRQYMLLVETWWDSAKQKVTGFLNGVKTFVGDILPDSFLVGLSKLGDFGKKIWDFVSSLAGTAYQWLTSCVDKAKQYLETVKNQLVANVLKVILNKIYPKNVGLYNQIVTACNKAGINTGLQVDQKQPVQQQAQPQQAQQPQQKSNINIADVAQFGDVVGGDFAQPRELLGALIEKVFKDLVDVFSDDIKLEIVQTLFPFKSGSPEAIGMLFIVPLLQTSGTLTSDMFMSFFEQIHYVVKKGGGKFGHLVLKEERAKDFVSTFHKLLVSNFNTLTGAIVGLIKGSNFEMILRTLVGDVGAAKNVIIQFLQLLVDKVKEKMNSKKQPDETEKQEVEKQLQTEAKVVRLADILYGR